MMTKTRGSWLGGSEGAKAASEMHSGSGPSNWPLLLLLLLSVDGGCAVRMVAYFRISAKVRSAAIAETEAGELVRSVAKAF